MNKIKNIILFLLVLVFLALLSWGGYNLIQKATNQELTRLAQESRTIEEPSLPLEKKEFEISDQKTIAREANIYLVSERDQVNTGEIFNLEIWLNGQGQVVDGAEFLISFNSELVKLEEPELGSFFSLYPFKKVDNQKGEARVIALQDVDGNKNLEEELMVKFRVTALKKGEASFTFDLEKTHIACCAGQELLKEAVPLTIKID